MALSPRLEMRQGQSLVMTPQLSRQSSCCSFRRSSWLNSFEGELERNPLLERAEPEGGDAEAPREAREDASVDSSASHEEVPISTNSDVDADFEAVHPDMSSNEASEASRRGADNGLVESWIGQIVR